MIVQSFKNIALATIGASCVAFGVATEAQALRGTLNISNERGFIGTDTKVEFSNNDIEYYGTGVFEFFDVDPEGEGDGFVNTNALALPGGPVDSFFTFEDNNPFVFNLIDITLANTSGDEIKYDLIGTITNNEGKSFEVDGQFTSQMVSESNETGSSWSVTLKTTTVPEPSTMLGLGLVAAASAFGLKKKKS